jgi:RHS repeat-associated protein
MMSYSGNQTTVTDEAGKQSKTQMDGLERLTSVWEAPSTSGYNFASDYAYDVLGNLQTVIQKGDNATNARNRSFTYDSLSRLLCAANPEVQVVTCPESAAGPFPPGAVTYTYNGNGNLSTKTAPSPNQPSTGTATVTTTYQYDTLNRLTYKSYQDSYTTNPSTPYAQFKYDSCSASACGPIANVNQVGRLVSTWSPNYTGSIYNYDPVGRIANSLDCIDSTACNWNFTIAHTYDLIGDETKTTENITTWTGPVLTSITLNQCSFDGAGRPTCFTSSWVDAQHPATLVTVDPNVGYYPTGAMRKLKLGNSLFETFAYNNRLEPCRMNVNSSGGYYTQCGDPTPNGNTLDFTYGFNWGAADNGNVSTWSATGQQSLNRTYVYDSLNRLQSMSAPGSQCSGLSWTVDAWGNRTDQNVTGGSCLAFHSGVATVQNRFLPPYQYDAAGNMVYDGTHHYTYDAENRVIQVDGGTTASYAYDPSGRRVSKTTGGQTTNYGYDLAGNAVFETQGSTLETAYIYFGGVLQAKHKNSTTYFVHQDHLESASLLTNLTGGVVDCNAFYPFGEQDSSTCTSSNITTHKFTGKERDAESGLDYFLARHYTSTAGRFMSPDRHNPMLTRHNLEDGGLPFQATQALFYGFLENPQNWNQYAYVRNNPLKLVDPTGAWPWSGDGHHLFGQAAIGKTIDNPIAKDFIAKIKTGAPNIAPNIGYTTGHIEYDEAVEQFLETQERTMGDRNFWTIAQWKEVATQLLNSPIPAIKNFLDELDRNNPNARKALADAIAAYRFTTFALARIVSAALASSLARLPLIIYVDVQSMFRQTPVQARVDPEPDRQPPHPRCLMKRENECVD